MSAGRFSPYIRRVGIPLVLAVVGTVTLGVGVFAATIKDDHLNTTAAEFSEHACDGFGDRTSSQDGWHFIVPDGGEKAEFTNLTFTFSTADGNVTGTIVSKDAAHPTVGAGWKGWLDKAGNGPKALYKHAYLVTTAGWRLTAASADIVPSDVQTFNLSHTCPGTPVTPSPSASPSVSPSASTSPSPEVSESPSTSTSPSPEVSESPSASTSPSPEVSESPSASTSPSPEVSESPSVSPSPEVSESPSASESPSTSPSPEASESPSTSPSPETSQSPSTSPSPEASESASPTASPSPTTIEMLPTTGSSFGSILIVAGSLLLLGGGLMMVATRRRLVEIE
ncbi:MAG: LPXTG cell wall anchor domain-containing protein [Hamadaea sp.]|nr:LPXTG cell wall anchor domain-containing protein [Hamadaea sp.]